MSKQDQTIAMFVADVVPYTRPNGQVAVYLKCRNAINKGLAGKRAKNATHTGTIWLEDMRYEEAKEEYPRGTRIPEDAAVWGEQVVDESTGEAMEGVYNIEVL